MNEHRKDPMPYADLREAVEDLHAARLRASDARIREDRAKEYIAKALDATGAERALVGRFEVIRELRRVSRLDQKGLRESCPDVWQRFLMADAAITLKLRELPG